MSNRNPVGDFSGIANNGQAKARMELLLANVLESPAGAPEDAVTIAGGLVTPSHALLVVDTEAAAATDDLDRALITNHPAGRIIAFRSTSSARVITIKHMAGGGDGQFSLLDGVNIELDDPDEFVAFVLIGVVWKELPRTMPNRFYKVEDHTEVLASPYVLKPSESNRKVFTNRGITAKGYYTLPAAAAGMRFRFHVVDADGIRVVAAGGDTIRWKNNLSGGAGYIESTTIGDVIDLECLDGTEWVDTNHGGTKTVV